MSQNEKILKYFNSGGRLTHASAWDIFRCSRLAARVKDLRNLGHNIEKQTKINKTEKIRFAEYWIPRQPIQQNLFDA